MAKFGIHSFVWTGSSQQDALDRAVGATAELGYDLIELSYLDPKAVDLPWLVRRLEEEKLGVAVSMGLPADGDIAGEDPAGLARGKTILEDAVSLTRDLGGTKLGGILFGAHGKSDRAPSRAGWESSVSVVRRVADKARAAGVTLNLEIVNRFESNLLNTAAQGLAFIKDTGADNVFLHLDTFHMNIEEADPGLAIRAATGKIGYVHIGENHRGALGTGNIDFGKIFDALVAVGYDDVITFESFSSEIVDADLSIKTGIWRNMWTDNRALAKQALSFVRDGYARAVARSALAQRPDRPVV